MLKPPIFFFNSNYLPGPLKDKIFLFSFFTPFILLSGLFIFKDLFQNKTHIFTGVVLDYFFL